MYTYPTVISISINGSEVNYTYPETIFDEMTDDAYQNMAMIEPEQKVNQRVRDKRSKLEALKDFNREHVENPMSADKRRRLKVKRKKR